MFEQKIAGPDGVVHGHEVDVRLVEEDGNPFGHLREEFGQLGVGEGHAGRVVRAAQEHGAGVGCDGPEHPLQVVRARAQRSRDLPPSGGLNRDRIGLEGTPRQNYLSARRDDGSEELLDERGRTVADHDAVVGPLVESRDVGDETRGEHVGIPVERTGLGRDDGLHRGKGRKWGLVRREFDDVGPHPLLSGNVGRQGEDFAAEPVLLTHVPSMPRRSGSAKARSKRAVT